MGARDDERRPLTTRTPTGGTFELERFAWSSPDQLEVAGRFTGVRDVPAGSPVLVVRADDRTHRLPPVPDAGTWPPEDGKAWRTAFTWQEPPAPFEVAELELGGGLVVELPEPGSGPPDSGSHLLDVQRAPASPEDGAAREEPVMPTAPTDGAERVRLQAALVAAQEEFRETSVAMRAAQEELSRVRGKLDAERKRRASDADRFREKLESLRRVAEETVAAERDAAQKLAARLQAAEAEIDARERSLRRVQEEADAVAAGRADERAEMNALRERVAALEPSAQSADRLRERLEMARRGADELRGKLASAVRGAQESGSECERLRQRLKTIRRAVDEGG